MRAKPGDSHFLNGGGAMGALMRAHDWASTPFGVPEQWPQSLRSAVSIMLNSRFPIALYWGAELALLYNDDWSPIPGGKHPWALGRPGREVWPEIWDTIGPLYEKVISTGEGVWQQDELLPMLRHGYLEECYYNFTFSPVMGEDGTIDGIFNAVVETTDRVLSERRLRTLSRMGQRASPSLSIADACAWTAGILADNRADVPFACVYVCDGESARRVASTLSPGSDAAPETLPLGSGAGSVWPLGDAETAGRAIVTPAPTGFGLSSAYWSEPITEVVTGPIMIASDDRPSAFLVAGANPRRRVDDNYRAFFELAAGHIGTALATARTYENERERAAALAEIDRAKTNFFSNVSHEFRTPLTLMLGPLEDALSAAEDEAQRERLGVAHRNALRLLRLVNALLDFSRIEAGRIDASYQPTDLARLTSELASSFRAATDKAGLALIIDTPSLAEPVFVDRDMWETIVLNLVSNAFKFTEKGEIHISLRAEDGRAVLRVRDSGTGIPESELPRLFDRFHRVEGASGRTFEGTGIGLALVKELVTAHGGTITAESESSTGSTFIVELPFGAGHLPPDRIRTASLPGRAHPRTDAFAAEALRWISDPAASFLPSERPALPSPSTTPGSVTGTGDRILLVDDNADLRDYIGRLLHEAGYEVTSAADGEQALAELAIVRPDLVISDVMMPKLDGFGLLSEIRRSDALRNLPVIMLSARAGEEAKVDGLDAGADDYLTKPFSARELLARVSVNIRLARLRRKASDALRASEEKLRQLNEALEQRVTDALAEKRLLADIVEVTDAPVQAIGPDYRFLAINGAAQQAYERVFAVRPQVGDSLLKVLAHLPEQREAAEQAWRRALDGTGYNAIAWWGDEQRERRAYEMRFRPLFDAQGIRIGAYLFGYDVTERLLEQDRLASAEEQLRQVQKLETMGQLTGGVAHDFNNLLTPIVGALDMLQRKGIGGGREQRLIGGAAQSAERAKTLVQRLLAFARRQPLKARAVDIAALVGGMADLIGSTTGPKVRVTMDIADDLPNANADPNQLEMALLNLAVNARDAMPDGGTLQISAKAERVGAAHRAKLEPGNYVRLLVADTGTGMSDEVLSRAIEPFFSTKGVGKGTGLGLSMVHGLVSQLGGALTIQSRGGLGTTIELWLPVSEERASVPEDREPAQLSVGGAGTVLLVDDEELVRASTAEMLGELGFSVVEAGSADEALSLLDDGLEPQLLVTDHLMPGMNGTDLARRVRSERRGMRVLLISGYADADGIAPDLPRLTKPFRNDELAASLAALDAN